MERRSRQIIEADLKKIQDASEIAKSMAEIEKITGLSNMKIQTTLSKKPTISKKVKEKIAKNKELTKKRREQEINAKKNNFSEFVIDASITGNDNLNEVISECLSKGKIILTSVTIRELENLQLRLNKVGKDARYILSIAAEDEVKFETVLIDENLDIPDDCIIQYCARNKDKMTLVTSDKTMALKARMYSVKVQYIRKNEKKVLNANVNAIKKVSKPILNNKNIRYSERTKTLVPANKIGNKLIISKFETYTMSIRVYSYGLEYNEGPIELKIGDDVYVSTQKNNYITFAHYRITSLASENNCELIYSRRVYDLNNIDVPRAAYKTFIKDFKVNHNL